MGELAENEGQLPGVEDPAWLRVIELGTLCCLPMALKAAINLNVMDILSKQAPPHTHLSAAQIIAHLHIFPSSRPRASACLDRILRVLACHGVLSSSSLQPSHSTQPVPTYALNDVSKFFVKNEDGASLAPMMLMNQDKVFMETWHYLDEAVLDGIEPFTRAHGKDAFTYGQDDVRLDKLFNSAMAGHTQLLIKMLLDSYSGLDDVSTLVDVGGGFGTCLRLIVSKHPNVKGINFDQPHVIAAAPVYAGVENVEGDMFVSIPKGDAIFMKWILHDWSDEHCLKILKNCYEALPDKGGKVIVIDALLPTSVETGARARLGYHLDILMLAYNQGGRERTKDELFELSRLAGFTSMQVVSKLNECTIVELHKM
ncbi:hypothetical protein GOP47_0021537 [Adiantum capillus-veneris]|uniref:Uncharacterized protein n=1 Tax=Adiantum capillus-veneris TaxID=13818 RepID=A0A9D4U7Y3_ADICA|nr:hypothetical protein GOP47_0021537 [Adiantum capillus-veneris]